MKKFDSRKLGWLLPFSIPCIFLGTRYSPISDIQSHWINALVGFLVIFGLMGTFFGFLGVMSGGGND